MSAINGITQDPMAKVAQVLVDHQSTLDEHGRRIGDLEEAREKDARSREEDARARRNLTWSMILQSLLFILNLIVTLTIRGAAK